MNNTGTIHIHGDTNVKNHVGEYRKEYCRIRGLLLVEMGLDVEDAIRIADLLAAKNKEVDELSEPV